MFRRLIPMLLAAVVLAMAGPAAAQAPTGPVVMGAEVSVPLGAPPAGTACPAYVADLNGRGWVVFANGQPIPAASPWFDCPDGGNAVGHAPTFIDGDGADAEKRRQAWRTALGGLGLTASYSASLGFGPPTGSLSTPTARVTLQVADRSDAVAAAVAFAVVAGLFLLAFLAGFAKDPAPAPVDGVPVPDNYRRTYSLARAQLLWWSGIVLWAFLALYVTTGTLDSVTTGVMALMGIVGGTTVLAFAQDNRPGDDDARRQAHAAQYAALAARLNPPAGAPAPSPEDTRRLLAGMKNLRDQVYPQSRGLLSDMLADAHGFSAHRLQLLLWTVAIGVVFVHEVLRTLGMPELSANLLALTGISNGTYFGFKMQEQQIADPAPAAPPPQQAAAAPADAPAPTQ